MQVDFYQLSRDPVEQILPVIAQRLLDEGERLLVVDGREGALPRLSRALWEWRSDSFLAHAMAEEGDVTAQPILLSTTDQTLNNARHIALTDGQWRESALEYDRAFYFFDTETIDGARICWKALKQQSDVTSRFWRQEGGKWMQGP